MPHNFSYVIPGRLAGMGRPGAWCELADDLWALKREGIGAVVCLTPTPTDPEAMEAAGLAYLHLPVEDFTAPTPEQVDRFVTWARESIDAGVPVAVHCGAGLGRTGTMLACYLVALGEDPDEAIRSVRRIRPGSIETPEQEGTVRAYAKGAGA